MLTGRKHLFQQINTPPKKEHLHREQAEFLSVNDISAFLISNALRVKLMEILGKFPSTSPTKNCAAEQSPTSPATGRGMRSTYGFGGNLGESCTGI